MALNSDFHPRGSTRLVGRRARGNWAVLGLLVAGLTTSALFWAWLVGMLIGH